MPDRVSVSIIIVTQNGAAFMEGLCLSLIKAEKKVPYELVVIDNGSRDATVDIIKRHFTEARIFFLNKNTGFSHAANLGAKKSSGEYLFFLNQDTEVESRVITNLLKAAHERKDAGLFGAKMKYANHPELINSFGHTMNRIGFAWDYGIGEVDGEKFNKEKEATGVCGGALFIKRDLFLQLGGFDERFFMYGEDVDLGLRVIDAGYKVVAVPDAIVLHYKNLFSGNVRHFEYLDQKNRWRIVLKNFPQGLLAEAIKGAIKFDLISLCEFLIKLELNKFFWRSMAIIYTLFSLPEIIQKRKKRNLNILFRELPKLIEDGKSYPEVDLSHLLSRYEWSVSREILKQGFIGRLANPKRVLLLRGPEPGMVNKIYDVLKEIYPQAEVNLLIGDKRKIEGFKGNVLRLPYQGRISYFFKLWLRIFKKFDLILILRKDAIFKIFLALISFPKETFTIDNAGRLEKVGILKILQEIVFGKVFLRSLIHILKKVLLRLIFSVGEVIFSLAGLRKERINKILFIQLGQLGDLILETVGIEAIRKKFKNARIISLTGPWGEELVKRDPLIDKVIVYNARWLRPEYMASNSKGLLRTIIALWRERIDLSIDFRGEANSIILAYLSGARLRLGYSIRSQKAFLPIEDVKFLLNLPYEYSWEKRHKFHQVEHNLRLLKKLGIDGEYKPRGFFNEEDKAWAEDFFKKENLVKDNSKSGGHLIIIHPGSSRMEKSWSKEKFSRLIQKLQSEYNVRVVLVGTKTELELGQEIISTLKEKTILAMGKTDLGKLTALINKADLFIGNESGPMHIASALAIPTIAIMSGVPSLYGPYKTRSKVIQKRLPCWSPWIEHCYCPRNTCQCLIEIEVEDVWDGVTELMNMKKSK